jgi:hypothetical protein
MATLRLARFDDHQKATALLARLGLVMPVPGTAATAHWARLWRENPALAGQRDPALGWVLEDGGRMVGFFANFLTLYQWGGRSLRVAVASQWGVEREHRGETAKLADAYFAQDADLILVTTAIKPTGRIFARYGGRPVPQPQLDRVPFWICDHRAFLAAAARKKNIRAAALAAAITGPVAATVDLLRRRPRPLDKVAVADGFGPGFDALWQDVLAGPPRLAMRRDTATLAWHYAPHAARGTLAVFTLARDARPAGYAVVVREDAPAIGLKRAKLVDALVPGDDPAALESLLAAALHHARATGCAVLELAAAPPPLLDVALARGALTRSLPVWPCWYVPRPGLPPELERPEAWWLTGYDGDTALF